VFADESHDNSQNYLSRLAELNNNDEVWAVLPIDQDDIGKGEERHSFFRRLHGALQTLFTEEKITGTFVISHNLDALTIARSYGAKTFQSNSNTPQAHCIQNIASILRVQGARSILTMSMGSALVTHEHIEKIIHLGRFSYTAVLAPTIDNGGTQAFLLRPPGYLPLQTGKGSFRHNIQLAKHNRLRIAVYAPEAIRFATAGSAQLRG